MLHRIVQIRRHERRTVFLLGSFTFLMLAATTLVSAAGDALFVEHLGADRLVLAIALAQFITVIGFSLYRLLRRKLAVKWVNPVVNSFLFFSLGGMALALLQGHQETIFAVVVLAPLLAGLLGSEYGRLSAALIDARSARRLLPILGAIGGGGASFGAFAMSSISARIDTVWALFAAAGLLLLTTIPAAFIKESQRPRVTTANATLRDVFAHRYARIALLSGAVIIALSTIVRVQFGAMVTETYTGAEIAVFYADFYFWLNLASIGFALIGTNLIIKLLGAAKSLLIYPSFLAAISLVGATLANALLASGTQLVASGTQFIERLFRQNVHNTASTIVNMPVPVHLRIRQALLASGTVKPIAVLITSTALFGTFGDQALLATPLTWQALYWPVAALSILLSGMMIYLWRHYAPALNSALNARRLHLETIGSEAVVGLEGEPGVATLDDSLETTLQRYLKSEQPERVALALDMLNGYTSPKTANIICEQWPTWATWLKSSAVTHLAELDTPVTQTFLDQAQLVEDPEVQAQIYRVRANQRSSDDYWQLFEDTSTPAALGAVAGQILAERRDAKLETALQSWSEGNIKPEPAKDTLLATALLHWPDNRFDAVMPKLFEIIPEIALQIAAKRPDPLWTSYCIPLLYNADHFEAARLALIRVGEPAVPDLEEAAAKPFTTHRAFNVLAHTEGHKAHLAGMRLMQNQHQSIRAAASKARLASPFEISLAEANLADENVTYALDQAERFHSYMFQTEGLQHAIAKSERDAAMEDLFLNLSLQDRTGPFRLIYFALTDSDKKQRALAIELLDAHAPKKLTRRLEPILEETQVRNKYDMLADRHWLELEERLDSPATSALTLRDLKLNRSFQDWRVSELECLAAHANPDYRPVPIVLREQNLVGIEQTLLTGVAPELNQDDKQLPLDQLYATLSAAPRCGHLWLKALASRVPQDPGAQDEVTRSSMVSLASRAVEEDRSVASDQDIWQRMFFLRSSALGQNLPSHRLKLLAGICKTIHADAGTVVVNERRLGHHFYLLCTGAALISQNGKDIGKIGPSEGFGALALIQGSRRPMTVTLAQDSELIAISRVDFLDLIELHPELVRSLARTIAEQIVSLQG